MTDIGGKAPSPEAEVVTLGVFIAARVVLPVGPHLKNQLSSVAEIEALFFFYTNQPVGYIKDVTSFYLFQ